MVLSVIKYVSFFKEILNLEEHLNRTTGSRFTSILLNGWILPIGGASAVEGLLLRGPTPFSLISIYQFCAILTKLVPFRLVVYF